MNFKFLLIAILMVAVMFAGCTGDHATEEEVTENVTQIPEENISEEETVEMPEEPAYEPMDYPVRLKNYHAIPSSFKINRTDTVTWINQQDDPKRYFTIRSGEGLWDNTTIGFQQKFTYQFNESGIYTAYVPPWNGMNVTITVK